MITSFAAKSGFASELPALKGRVFEFSAGLNILFGPNGCGKSTILKLLRGYSGVGEMGWTRYPSPSDASRGWGDNDYKFPEVLKNCALGIDADVDWDGSPTFYADTASEGRRRLFEDAGDGTVSDIDELNMLFARPSAGQNRAIRFNALEKTLSHPPDLTKWPRTQVNDVWAKCYGAYQKFLESLPKTGPITVLLDEPDRSLSIENQQKMWSVAIPRLVSQYATPFQVIVATHSPFALTAKDARYHDMIPGYVERSKAVIAQFAKEISGEVQSSVEDR